MDKLSIKSLIPEQWQILKAIRLKSLRDSPDAFASSFEIESQFDEAEWRRRLEKTDRQTFVAFSAQGTPIGMAVGAPYGDQIGLFAMWVDAHHRNKGVGSGLVNTVIQWSRKMNYSNLFLDVSDNNPQAIKLYESKGFIKTGVKDHLPSPREHITEHQRQLIL